ncbi:MAG: hypothetical protein Q4F41_09410 [Eubacteriales bacterium]|nr:hypothetical protein [Eubacteriales bacterium]
MNYLSREQLQEKLHLTEKQAKAFFFLPDLPVIKIGRKKLIAEETLDAWLEKHAAAGDTILLDYTRV